MRIAALYDIHANLPALEAVLAELQDERIDHVVVGGDVVAGPFPSESLRLLYELAIPTHFIRGNAESEVLRCAAGTTPNGLTQRADDEARWLVDVLSEKAIRFIADWPATITFDVGRQGQVLFCHATPDSDVLIVTRRTPESTIDRLYKDVNANVVVCGHTHIPFDRMVSGVCVVNAGSVGMPFGKTGADWLLISDTIEFRHTDYDLQSAAERILRSEYPYAEFFAETNVLNPPSEHEALDWLSQLGQAQPA